MTLFEQYRKQRQEEEDARKSKLFMKANHILGMYRRKVLHRPAKDTAVDLQAFFDLLDEGWTAPRICEKIEAYADWLKGEPGINPKEFCDKVRESNTEDLFLTTTTKNNSLMKSTINEVEIKKRAINIQELVDGQSIHGFDAQDEVEIQIHSIQLMVQSMYALAHNGMTLKQFDDDGYLTALDHQLNKLKSQFLHLSTIVNNVHTLAQEIEKLQSNDT
jgi:hypothetical protein